MAIDSLRILFDDVRATYPGVRNAPVVMGAFAGAASGTEIGRNLGLNIEKDEPAPFQA